MHLVEFPVNEYVPYSQLTHCPSSNISPELQYRNVTASDNVESVATSPGTIYPFESRSGSSIDEQVTTNKSPWLPGSPINLRSLKLAVPLSTITHVVPETSFVCPFRVVILSELV